MSGCHIRRRTIASGATRYDVSYRQGGRGFPVEHAGTFERRKDAEIRRGKVLEWLAAGRDPRAELEHLVEATKPGPTVSDLHSRFLARRRRISERTREAYRQRSKRLLKAFGTRPAKDVSADDVNAWIDELVEEGLAAGTIATYVRDLRLVLDALPANVARTSEVELPLREEDEIDPPDAPAVEAILRLCGARWRLPIVLLEQTGMRVGELSGLRWEDVDVQGSRFRLPRQRTKTRRPRWVEIPEWLMEIVAELRAPEDRDGLVIRPALDRRVLRTAMARACRHAEIAHYHPHDLRHRRVTLWVQQGVHLPLISERIGHKRVSMTLDRYAHVMPLREVDGARLHAFLTLGEPAQRPHVARTSS